MDDMTDELKDKSIPAQRAAARPDPANRPVAGWEAEAAALRAKTEHLRALRLAREAASPPAPKKAAARKGSSKQPAAKPSGPSTLSAWLEDQQKSGRRT